MARKNFKSDLGKLITSSSIKFDISEDKKKDSNNSNDKLNFIINQLKQELHLWRTGKLTVDIFEESIKEYKLKYDAEKNEFTQL